MADELELDFSTLAPQEVNVRGPNGVWYIMRSASADATVKYQNASMKTRKWDTQKGEDGKDKIKIVELLNVADTEPLLVSLCLCETEGGKRGELLLGKNGLPVHVPEALIRQWPGEVLEPLFELAIKVSPWLRKTEPEKTPDPKDSSKNGEDSST